MKKTAGILLTLLLISVLLLVFKIQPVRASGSIYIDADGSIYPPTAPISTLDNVTYTLTGDIVGYGGIAVRRDNIVLDGAGYTVQGTNASQSAGIDLLYRSNVTIKNMSITAFSWGIKLDSSSNNTVSGNDITNNVYGIPLFSSSGNTMYGNNIAGNHYGIWLFASSNNSISENTFTNDGLFFLHAYGNFVSNNTVNNKPLVYFENVSDQSIHDAGQVILFNCENIRVEGCNLSNTDIGVQLIETNNSTLSGNNIAANGYGIWLSDSSNNSISENTITANRGHGIIVTADRSSLNNSISANTITNNGNNGIGLERSNYTTIIGNTITNNNWDGIEISFTSDYSSIIGNTITNNDNGIFLSRSNYNSIIGNTITNNDNGINLGFYGTSNNSVYHNNFINNTRQVYSPEPAYGNVWDDGYPSGGNYWSDYDKLDEYQGPEQNISGSDGIGDTPYAIDENNQDNYPLMEPWKPSILGDVNGDGTVDIFDVVLAALAFGSTPDDPNWNQAADLNNDDVVDIFDIVLLANNFGKTLL